MSVTSKFLYHISTEQHTEIMLFLRTCILIEKSTIYTKRFTSSNLTLDFIRKPSKNATLKSVKSTMSFATFLDPTNKKRHFYQNTEYKIKIWVEHWNISQNKVIFSQQICFCSGQNTIYKIQNTSALLPEKKKKNVTFQK